MHRSVVEGSAVRSLLESARAKNVPLCGGIDSRSATRVALIEAVDATTVHLRTEGFDCGAQPQLYFQFEMDGTKYFFAAPPARSALQSAITLKIPTAIYRAERRDIRRSPPTESSPTRVELRAGIADYVVAPIRDWSHQGLSVSVEATVASRLQSPLRARFIDGDRRGEVVHATIRNRRSDLEAPGWVKLGLAIGAVPRPRLRIPLEQREFILPGGGAAGWRKLKMAASSRRKGSQRESGVTARSSRHVAFENDRGESIRGILDSTGATQGGVAVVIPPAWGRTKETTLPLAAALLETFESAGESIAVLRFDGTHRKGESYIAPDFRQPGDEYLGFRFSRAVTDIHAAARFLHRSSDYAPRKLVLVTFSLGAIEGRRALATGRGLFDGWVSVVGMADLQSGLRSVSGGVDFAYGYVQGVRFGQHELVGVVADMDATGEDALEHRMVFLEDARKDMASISVPVTWIHGRYDAWMDLGRVRDVLSAGDLSNRRLIEVPTGHQMRNSREALQTFQLIAQEVGEIALSKRLQPVAPDVVGFARQQKSERERLPEVRTNLRRFWREYLLGADGSLGIELLTATSAYTQLMTLQIEELLIRGGQELVDLGAGAGDFAVQVARAMPGIDVTITAVDYVSEALIRGRARLSEIGPSGLEVRSVVADLDLARHGGVPLRAASSDGLLASLLISYVDHPEAILREALRVLRPGGRLVLSSLRRDADISRIYADGVAELPPDRIRDVFGEEQDARIQFLQRKFINNAARILELEESGGFRFYDSDELVRLVEAAGFGTVRCQEALGVPPQATVVSAVAPAVR